MSHRRAAQLFSRSLRFSNWEQKTAGTWSSWKPSLTQQRARWGASSEYQHFRGRGSSAPWNHKANLYVFGAVGAFGCAFYVSRLETIPYTHRRHALFISEKREKAMGTAIFAEVKNDAAAQHSLVPEHHPLTRRVRNIGLRIAKVASEGYDHGNINHMKDLEWEFVVVDKPMVNAFVVPGGKVVVYTGLLRLMSREDELAAVLAHEVAHVVARHSAERVSEMGVMAVIRASLSIIFGFHLPPQLGVLAITLPHSRRAETEADIIGSKLMARACFDPSAVVSMLTKLDTMEKKETGINGRVPNLLRTHPVTSERVSKARQELPAAQQLYHDSGCRMVYDSFFG